MSYHADPRGIPTRDEERELARRIRAGDEAAWAELVDRNIPLAMGEARRQTAPGKSADDAAQAAMLGLMRAARDFDPEKHPGIRFATYAIYWIRREVFDHTHENTLIRRPKYTRRYRKLASEGLSRRERKTQRLCSVAAGRPMPIQDLLSHSEDGGIPAADEPPIDRLIREEELERLRESLPTLDERSRDVLERRTRGATMKDVGKHYGVTREWIRQIENEAIKQLADLMDTPRGRCRTLGSNGRTY